MEIILRNIGRLNNIYSTVYRVGVVVSMDQSFDRIGSEPQTPYAICG